MEPKSVPLPISEPTQTTTSQSSLPKLNNKMPILFVLLLLGVLLAGGGYYMGIRNQTIVPASIPSSIPVNTVPTSDPTANWKVFNNVNGYLLRYPAEIKVGNTGYISTEAESQNNVRIFENITDPLLGPHMNIVVIQATSSLESEAIKNYQANLYAKIIPAKSIKPVTKTTFLQNEAFEYTLSNKGFVSPVEEYIGYEGIYNVVWINGGLKYYMISWTESPTFNQILSTFKFTSGNSSQTKTSNSIITGSVQIYSTTADTMTLHFAANSQVGKVIEMKIWTDSDKNANWESFAVDKIFKIGATVYVQFKDEKGNISGVYSDTIFPPAGLH